MRMDFYDSKTYFCRMGTVLKNKCLLVIGQVWPESNSSAAGKRMLQLLNFFKNCGMEIYFGSTANKSEYSDDLSIFEIHEIEIRLNDSKSDEILKNLNPDIVLYDRFMMEEQFGWKIGEQCPRAMTILDTEDLHFLRYARQEIQKKGGENLNKFLYSDRTKRELASIMRCDLSLLISKYERDLLVNQFKVPEEILYFLPFLEEKLTKEVQRNFKRFEEREGFVFIGNFIHEPNWETVLRIKNEVWPLIRIKLPRGKMHVYGAYPSEKVFQLHNEKQGFLIHGRVEDALDVIGDARAMLAPISFGAGLKGKFIDAMRVGTPSVTTSVGAEAMTMGCDWGGFIEDELNAIVDKAILLYTDEEVWKGKQQLGIELLNEVYANASHCVQFQDQLESVFLDLESHRQNCFLGQVMKHSFLQNTKYMGLWIEEKNKKKDINS